MSANYINKDSYITDGYINHIHNPQSSIFVSANAGSGKTSLLTKRVLSLLLAGVPPAKILCLTFTKAAAAEMEQRILAELGKWVMAGEHDLHTALEKLLERKPNEKLLLRARSLFATVLEAPEGVRIQTIHGFCQSLLKRFPLEAGINPYFTVMDGRTEQEMLKDARLALFNAASGKLREAIGALAQLLSSGDFDDLLSDIVQNKFAFHSLFMQPGGFDAAIDILRTQLQVAHDETLETLTQKYFRYDEATQNALLHIAEILAQGQGASDQETSTGIREWFSTDKRSVANYCSIYMTKKNTPRTVLFTKKTLKDSEQINLLVREQERAERFSAAHRSLKLAERTEHVFSVAQALLSIYDENKNRHARMDYDDLILTARDLLKRPGNAAWVLYKLDGGIDHVLVDEAQDTSPEQWEIVAALTEDFFAGESKESQDRSLFIVGDEKQSIFSFQGAEVRLLAHMREYFQSRIEAAGKTAHTLALTRSFRSVPQVLQAVDAVFSLTHTAHREQHNGLVELWPLVLTSGDGVSLPRLLADTIHGWLKKGLWLEGKNRYATAGDIMVLVRTRTTLVDQLTRALKRRGVPVAGIDRMVLSKNLAIQDLMALGDFLLLPEDDLTLAALLKSPIGNMSEEDLFALSAPRGGKSLWDMLQASAHTKIIALLHDLRAKTDFLAPFELYTNALSTLKLRNHFIGRMGEEYNDAIDEFLSQALIYQRESAPSLQGFLHWLRSSDSVIKRDMEQAKDAVRIMTVHGAKGLQAPIVILPDTITQPVLKEKLLWHEENGFALPVWAASSANDDSFSASLREAGKVRMHDEYRRLLYVAMTRAEDHLYIFGARGKDEPNENCWYHLIQRALQPIVTSYETPAGEGLRLSSSPHRGEVRVLRSLGEGGRRGAHTGDGKSLPPEQASPLPNPPPVGEGTFSFLTAPPPPEENPPRPLAPSKLGDEPPAATPANPAIFARGLLIHTLLQYLPDIAKENREQVARACALPYQMEESERNNCIEEALALIENPQFADIFSSNAIAEAPLSGTVTVKGEPFVVSGQIDRLVISEKTITIVDYKTNQLPPATPPLAYRKQMGLYRLLLKEIFPGREIKAALLWTAIPRMDVLDEVALEVLDKA